MGLRAAAQIEVSRITIHDLKGMIDQGATVLILDTQLREMMRDCLDRCDY
jgi:hypothetical protein